MKKMILLLIVLMIVCVGFLSGCDEKTNEESNGMKIQYFKVIPTVINIGEAANLSWNVTEATTVSIDNNIGFVSSNGTILIQPIQNTTYTLTAKNLTDTKIVTAEIIVTINQSKNNNNQTILTVQEAYYNIENYLSKNITVVGYYLISSDGPCLIPANTAADQNPAIKIILDETSLNLAIQKEKASLTSNFKYYVVGVLQQIPLSVGYDVKIIVESVEAV